MNSVLCPYLEMFVIIFIDHTFIYSKNEEDHVEHLATVLRFLRELMRLINGYIMRVIMSSSNFTTISFSDLFIIFVILCLVRGVKDVLLCHVE